ncbi:MAG: DUF3467 domain-containing protein [Planctomycetales bacterium]|nr:DUF3467 domain-containing protein [Planctomycetales bacterium]
MTNFHPEDRPDPSEQPIRARVPDHVAAGAFSTGVIVMTAQTEFILDFVQNLGRPHQIVARVVMPHYVLPQLVDAMQRNIELYRNRWGELPQTGSPRSSGQEGGDEAGGGRDQASDSHDSGQTNPLSIKSNPAQTSRGSAADSSSMESGQQGAGSARGGGSGGRSSGSRSDDFSDSSKAPREPGTSSQTPGDSSGGHAPGRQASVQEIYDDLKIRDEFLSGAYANAVMIGHGPHEFSFDFITNFYPHSAVSSRVFLAAGQIPRLFESLKGTWEQLRNRMHPPPDNPFPSSDDNPFA